jgi:hypothetical protein
MESERKMNGTLQISKSGCTDPHLLPQYKKCLLSTVYAIEEGTFCY